MKNKSLAIKIISVIITVMLAGIDQFTKYLAVMFVKPAGSIPVLKFGDTEWINLTYCENTGMSFSMLEGQTLILVLIPIILIIGVEWYVFSGKLKRTDLIIALAALAGGGLGNLIDRAFMGYVVDFIDFKIINFAIFNFADICAVCGGIYFALMLIIEEFKEDKAKKAAENTPDTEAEENAGETPEEITADTAEKEPDDDEA